MSIQFNGVAVDSVYFNGSLLSEFIVNGVNVLSAPVGFVYTYDGTTTTVAGERYLVDSVGGDNALLKTGRGLTFDGSTQTLITSRTLSFTTDFTFSYFLELGLDSSAHLLGCFVSSSDRFITGQDTATTFRMAICNTLSNLSHSHSGITRCTVVVDVAAKSADLYLQKDYIGTHTWTSTLNTGLLKLANDGSVLKGIAGDWMLLREKLTPTKIEELVDYPERFLYMDGGTPKSTVLNQTTLDKLAISDGFRFVANEHSGSLVYNMVIPSESESITNYSETMRTNSNTLTGNFQDALVTQSVSGIPTGLATIDVQANSLADAQSQFLSENGLTLTDNAGQLEITK